MDAFIISNIPDIKFQFAIMIGISHSVLFLFITAENANLLYGGIQDFLNNRVPEGTSAAGYKKSFVFKHFNVSHLSCLVPHNLFHDNCTVRALASDNICAEIQFWEISAYNPLHQPSGLFSNLSLILFNTSPTDVSVDSNTSFPVCLWCGKVEIPGQ